MVETSYNPVLVALSVAIAIFASYTALDLGNRVRGAAPGQRWLVAGSAGSVAVCGFTAPWSPAQARLYTEAFGS